MECRIITILVLLVNTFCFSQEVSSNDINNGGGLIEGNNSQCQCSVSAVPSLIANGSFETYAQCPVGPSNFNYLNNWEQGTNTTTDYFNTCGFIFDGITEAGLLPFPDGQGAAGALFSTQFKEYLGTCLTAPMQAGTEYQLSFSVASIPLNDDGETCNNGIINYGAVDITIYGSQSCSALPVSTNVAPSANSQWTVIGHASYQPTSTWGKFTITFTPTVNVSTIIIGAPATLPASYENLDCFPYFLFDGLTLNKSSLYGASIAASGDFCSGNLVLAADTAISLGASATYQWSKGGVAIQGATSHTLNVSAAGSGTGTYSLRINDGATCLINAEYTVNSSMDAPEVQISQPDCSTAAGTITVLDTASRYSFNNGSTWLTSNVSPALTPGIYHVKVKTAAGCISASRTVVIVPQNMNVPVVQDVTYCQHSVALPLQASISNVKWYTVQTGGTALSEVPVPSTATTGTTVYFCSQSNGNGCESERVALHVTVVPAPSAPSAVKRVEYCQYAEAAPLYADGTNHLWYTTPTGGIGSANAPVPATDREGYTMYYVSSGNGECESARIAVTVVIFGLPAAPETKEYVTINNYDKAEALVAYGENLTWYDANKNVLDAAPYPQTAVIGTTTYYVSQNPNGCESELKEIVVEITSEEQAISFPNFFSPNGDGVHDVWNIAKPSRGSDAIVTIYDRYGKLIQTFKAGQSGWDGTANGALLPASDYWFTVAYTESGVTKEFNSHFSLVR